MMFPIQILYLWVHPQPSNSHHKDYYIFSSGSLSTFSFYSCWVGGSANLCVYIMSVYVFMNIQVEFMRRFRFKEVFSLHVPFFLQAFWCPEGVPIVIHICIYRMIYSTQKYRLDWYTIMYTYDKYIKCTLSMGVLCLVKLNGDFTSLQTPSHVRSAIATIYPAKKERLILNMGMVR